MNREQAEKLVENLIRLVRLYRGDEDLDALRVEFQTALSASPPAPAEGEREAGFREGLVAAAALVYGWQDADKNLTYIADAICGLTPGVNPECYADPDAANQAFDDLRRERDALRRVGAEVVEAYRACREANSMSGFWTHLDDLAALLDGRASPRPPSSPDPAFRREMCECGHTHTFIPGTDEAYDACDEVEDCGCATFAPAPSPDPGARPAPQDGRCRACGWPESDQTHTGTSADHSFVPPAPSPAAVEAPRRERCEVCKHYHLRVNPESDLWAAGWCDEVQDNVNAQSVCSGFAAPPQTKEGTDGR